MKVCYKILAIVGVLLFYSHIFSTVESGSKTVLGNGQIPFTSVSPEMVSGFRLERTYARKRELGASLQVALFGGKSTCSTSTGLARYFFPGNKTQLSVAEDDSLDGFQKEKDLLAQNFSIYTKNGDFRSTISLSPQQSIFGIGFHARYCFLRNPLKGNSVWMSVSTPLEQIRNRMNLQEVIINDGDGPDDSAGVLAVSNMKEAFNQQDWNFGKITDGVMTKTRLADIEVKLGYDNYLYGEPYHMELYGGLVIPTGNKYSGEYIFEPIVGRGKYVGLMSGGALGDLIWSDYREEQKLWWEVAVHGEYLFRNKQMRSFDLNDKEWSRYISLYKNKQEAQEAADLIFIDRAKAMNMFTPGINLLTQELYVSPGFWFDMNGAFVFEYNQLKIELGYNLFFKRAEDVSLVNPWESAFALKYAEGIGRTNPIRNISGNKYLEQNVVASDNPSDVLIPVLLENFDQSIIEESDLNLLSACTPALFSHTIYMASGGCFDHRDKPIMINGGLSYTVAHNNAVINKWLMWFKTGVSF